MVMPLLEDRAALGGLKNEDFSISGRNALVFISESTIKKANRSWTAEQAPERISSPEALKKTAVRRGVQSRRTSHGAFELANGAHQGGNAGQGG